MDIKEKIEEIVKKIKSDPKLLASFKDDPVKTIESLTGVDLPDGAVDQVVSGVKTALAADGASGIVDKIKNLF
ncbi:MAG: hypothetical protein K6G88_01735 [Lachnospiraceae bacterium]|nr:hypothetical protein [Lachnospiraceae bacterium]